MNCLTCLLPQQGQLEGQQQTPNSSRPRVPAIRQAHAVCATRVPMGVLGEQERRQTLMILLVTAVAGWPTVGTGSTTWTGGLG